MESDHGLHETLRLSCGPDGSLSRLGCLNSSIHPREMIDDLRFQSNRGLIIIPNEITRPASYPRAPEDDRTQTAVLRQEVSGPCEALRPKERVILSSRASGQFGDGALAINFLVRHVP